jgi:predicted transcriptional regulator of viral defense system
MMFVSSAVITKDAAMNPPSADAAAIELFHRQHGYARVADLRELGMTKNRIANRVEKRMYRRVAHGLVALGNPGQNIWARAMRGVLIAGSNAVAALWTAAELHDLNAPRDRQIHVVVNTSRQREPRPELYVHRTRYLPSQHVTVLNNVPTTSLARTIVDCAQYLDPWRALRVLDSCNASTRTWQEIHRTAERLSNGRAGVRTIANATAPDGAKRIRSTLERHARDALRACGIPDGLWNHTISDEHGPIREVDLCYADAKLIVELDGLAFHRSSATAQRDRATDRRLTLAGWRVLRFTWEDVVDRRDSFVAQVRDGLKTV